MKATKENMINIIANNKLDEERLNAFTEPELYNIGKIKGYWK